MRLPLGKTALLVLLMLGATEAQLLAYIDPGAGSLLYQIVAATMLGALFYVYRVGAWIKKHWKRPPTPRP